LGLLSLSREASGQVSTPPNILSGGSEAPDARLPVPAVRLRRADIPSELPPDLKDELRGTFDADAKARARHAIAIGKRGVRAAAAVPFLIRLLCDDADVGDPAVLFPRTVRDFALSALQAIGRPAVEPCIAALKCSSGEPRLALIKVLGWIRDPRAIDALASLLESPDPDVRGWVVTGLADIDDVRVVPSLVRALKDSSTQVRVWAANALTTHRAPQAVAPLIECLKDKANAVRASAARALGNQADRRAAPALLQILHDASEDKGTRFHAACSLGEIGDTGGHEALLVALNDRATPDTVRSGAAYGLGASGNVSYVQALTSVATDPRDVAEVRAYAIEGIVRLDGQKAIPLLQRLSKEGQKSEGVRCSAALCLVKLTGGAIEDVDTVTALRGPYLTVWYRPQKARWDALRSVAAHGKTTETRDAATEMLKGTSPGNPDELP
jgi:HEAT repeat protein